MAVTEAGRDTLSLPTVIGDWPPDTGQILERLVRVDGQRGARLLEALGVSRADVLRPLVA